MTAIVTPGYAPIEQYSAKGHQGAWTDIYALGAVCYRCLTGEVPEDATERLRDDPLVPAAQRCKGKASAALLNAIDRALRVDEGARPQSIAAWRAMLSNKTAALVYREEKETARPAVASSSSPSPSPGRKDSSLSKLVLAGALVGGAVYWWFTDGRPTGVVRDIAGEMVSIPAGVFRMGDLSGAGDDSELPVRSVTVPAFRLSKHEVTFAQWDACVADRGCNVYPPDDRDWWGRGNRPVVNVSWDDVKFFINWLNAKTNGNYRLPTEAEWEYAARAGTTTKYSWGDDIGENQANCGNDSCGDSYGYTAPVGSFPANPWGLHDMHGNVWEWVQDCWNDNYEGAPTDGSAWTSGNCRKRVFRGGSRDDDAWFLRSADRGGLDRADRNFHFLGFRLAQDE